MSQDLVGKTAFVTAAGQGIGRASALAYKRAGARVIATDINAGALETLAADGIETRLLDPGREAAALADVAGTADLVLVDAPCSGTGTWRRNPETRWRITPERLDRLTALQARLLDLAAELVRPGGILVYAVCSLLAGEGRDQAAALTGRSSLVPEETGIAAGRCAGSGRLLQPGSDGTDGFFVARWRRPC